MSFSGCSVGEIIYGDTRMLDEKRGSLNTINGSSLQRPLIPESLPFIGIDSSFDDPMLLHNFLTDSKSSFLIKEFLIMMAICNTVSPEYKSNSNVKSVEFQTSSPDEAALVIGARRLGVELVSRLGNRVKINIFGNIFI